MVTEENQHRGFVPLCQRLDQLAHKGIGLINLIDVVFKADGVDALQLAHHGNGLVRVQYLRGVLSVGLHRHRIDHILSRRGIQRLEDFRCQQFVLGPAQGVPLHPQHILHGRKGVKAQIGIDLVAVVEGARVVVDGVAGVALLLEGIVDRFTDVGLQNRLIGIFAGSEIVQAHTRQDFKFRVGRTRADGRHRQQTRGTEFFQRREIGHRVLGIGQSLEVFDIHKGLQLHRHNIRHDLRFGARGRGVRFLLFRLLLVQLVHHRTYFLR